jgi:NitT/TauT family transport system substrate-binding protein
MGLLGDNDATTGPSPLTRRSAIGRAAGWLSGAVGLGAAVAGCERGEPAAAAAQPVPLRVAMDLWAGYFPALLADDYGLFRQWGLRVELALPGNTDRMLAEFAAGRHDLVCLALADLVNLLRTGAEAQVVLHSDESAGGDKILCRRGANPQGGRFVVGTNVGGFGELFVREWVRSRGLAADRVIWAHVDAADVPETLKAGRIDCGHTWDPYAGVAAADGAEVLFTSAQTPGLIPDVVAGLRTTLERRGAEVRHFAAAWFEALDRWRADRADGDARVARRLAKPQQWVAEAAAGVRLVGIEENRRALGAGGSPPAMAGALKRYSDFFIAAGTLTRPLEPARVLRADLLP